MPNYIFTEHGEEEIEEIPLGFSERPMTEEERILQQMQILQSELTGLRDRMEKINHRWHYYQEPIDRDGFDFLQRELTRLIRGYF
jgi:hypothetical protein